MYSTKKYNQPNQILYVLPIFIITICLIGINKVQLPQERMNPRSRSFHPYMFFCSTTVVKHRHDWSTVRQQTHTRTHTHTHTLFWTASLHIPPVCQHVYPVSWSALAVVLTCVSNGRDVSSGGRPNEGNGHYENRGLLVARQEVWAGGRGQGDGDGEGGGSSLVQGLFGGCQQHPDYFAAGTAAVAQAWWTEQMESILCDGVWAVTDKDPHPFLLCSVLSTGRTAGLTSDWARHRTGLLYSSALKFYMLLSLCVCVCVSQIGWAH